MFRDSVSVNSTWYREYGLHPIKQGSGNTDFIASFPNWDDTIHALKTDFPKEGNVITPEYATLTNDLSELHNNPRAINERIREAREATKYSDATLHLGTPIETPQRQKNPQWLNAVLSIHRGEVESVTLKTMLLPVELAAGVIVPSIESRRIKDGAALLICAELYSLFFENKIPPKLANEKIDRLFASTMWATPVGDGQQFRHLHEEAGGEDSYYKQQLEMVVGAYTLKKMPTVQQIIIADKGRSDLPPYNAVFTRAGNM